jgi:putative amino-acid transport system substrate-binding protein
MKTSIWKKLLCLALAATMLLSMAACGSSSTTTDDTTAAEETTTEETTAAEEAAPAEEEEAAAEEEASPAEEVEAPAEEAEAPAEEEAAAAEDDLKTKWASLAGTTLRVATSGQQAGWSQDDGNGGVEGMDIDTMTYICDYYGINLEWVVADPTGIWGMLQSGEVDTIACVTTVNADRLDAYWFTNTYAWESYSIVSRTEDGIAEDGDLSFWDGKTICTPAGSNPALILEQIIEEQAANGVNISAVYPDSSAVLIQNVVSKETDAALMVTSTCAYKVRDLGYTDTLTIQNIQWKNMPIVYAWNRVEENKDVILAINDLLDEMHADGTLSEFSNKWFEMDITNVPDGEVNYVVPTGDDAWQSNEG